MIYPGLYSGAIGSLLRQIQEQKSQSPIVPPGAEVSTPARDIIEQPNQSIESPGTQRVISQRPEASNVAGGGSAILPETLSANQNVSYVAPRFAFGGGVDLGAGPTGDTSPQKTQQQFNSIQNNPEFSGVTTQPNEQLKYVAPQAPQITRPPDRDYSAGGSAAQSQEQQDARWNQAQAQDAEYQKKDNELQGIGISKQQQADQYGKTLASLLQQTKAKQVASQPTPTPAPQQGQVKGATTTAAKKSTPAPFYTQSPISWLATKIFGR